MAEQIYEFRVSAKELEYLRQLALGDESFARIMCLPDTTSGRGASLQLSRTAAGHVRDRLMNEMDMVGFDESYAPNERGQILEGLIDRFFLR